MWHTQGAAVTGRGHLLRGLPCQDRVSFREERGVTAAALSDGAGSARLSHHGAECAATAACEVLCCRFDGLLAAATPMEARRTVVEGVLEQVRRRAEELDAPLEELACTLLAVAVRGDDYVVVHVGDGVIGCQRDGRVRVASGPANGEFANTTTFVTSRNALLKTRVLRGNQPGLEGFVLMSDGCEAALYDKGRQRLAPLVGRLLQRAELLGEAASAGQLEAVLATAIAGRTRDDCSLALLTRKRDAFGRWDRLTQREQAAVLGIATGRKSRRRRQIRRYAEAYGAGKG